MVCEEVEVVAALGTRERCAFQGPECYLPKRCGAKYNQLSSFHAGKGTLYTAVHVFAWRCVNSTYHKIGPTPCASTKAGLGINLIRRYRPLTPS